MSASATDILLVAATGCRSNRCDAAALSSALVNSGLQVRHGLPAGTRQRYKAAMLSGCVVTAAAEAKSRRLAQRLLGSAERVYAAGCTGCFWSEAAPPEGVLDAREPVELVRLLTNPPVCLQAGPPRLDHARTRYHLKVQEGRPGACSYCIVPLLRPGSRSQCCSPGRPALRQPAGGKPRGGGLGKARRLQRGIRPLHSRRRQAKPATIRGGRQGLPGRLVASGGGA